VLVYSQSEDFTSNVPLILNASTPRTNFNMTAFADALGLGAPVAGTFFFTGPNGTTTASGSSATGTPSGAISIHSQLAATGVFISILAMYFLS
jgi:hypothetical protein